MKKMVITGVNGFIGRHAKEYFEKDTRSQDWIWRQITVETGSRATP